MGDPVQDRDDDRVTAVRLPSGRVIDRTGIPVAIGLSSPNIHDSLQVRTRSQPVQACLVYRQGKRTMMSEGGNLNVQILTSLMVCLGQTVRVVSEMLANEAVTDGDRRMLQAELGAAILTASATMDRAQPGVGEILLRIYTGDLSPEDVGKTEG